MFTGQDKKLSRSFFYIRLNEPQLLKKKLSIIGKGVLQSFKITKNGLNVHLWQRNKFRADGDPKSSVSRPQKKMSSSRLQILFLDSHMRMHAEPAVINNSREIALCLLCYGFFQEKSYYLLVQVPRRAEGQKPVGLSSNPSQ